MRLPVLAGVDLYKFFKGVARVTRTFSFEIGPLRARGVPAILVAVTGVVAAAGAMQALTTSVERLPETIRETRVLAQILRRNDTAQLHP